MNCKPGDLAFVVGSDYEQDGLIVRCIRLITPGDVVGDTRFMNPGVTWLVDRDLRYHSNDLGDRVGPVAPDENLRPIRDPGEDATDETLTWLPVPARETA